MNIITLPFITYTSVDMIMLLIILVLIALLISNFIGKV